jgi:non-canonical (house-cleaning) NTP pyrophosphatase
MSELPLVFMSTESALKHRAIAAVMERVGIPVRVEGKKLESGVEEQPLSMDETYLGAKNRHEALQKLGVEADYLATVESGLHRVHKDLGAYGCVAVIIEKVGEEAHTGFSLDIEYPKEVLDLVPSVYPDVGVWAQQTQGAIEKDPYQALTGGRLTRQDTIEVAAYNAALGVIR